MRRASPNMVTRYALRAPAKKNNVQEGQGELLLEVEVLSSNEATLVSAARDAPGLCGVCRDMIVFCKSAIERMRLCR